MLYRNPKVKIENDERFLTEFVTYSKDGMYPSDISLSCSQPRDVRISQPAKKQISIRVYDDHGGGGLHGGPLGILPLKMQ
ncbi:hypothetical protein [Bacillus sp. V5-8f]|uniref:hypothetical protein n=1 Tax=Bacillus sp. V5-8f TaxID=2053044 RepID=UPI000C78B5CA|nr:hypothetical protein [Bacillus sp. V5-8f]PLT32814.1 hypothetical protein CUU64_16850 [Bacillus sp. V5-8f]